MQRLTTLFLPFLSTVLVLVLSFFWGTIPNSSASYRNFSPTGQWQANIREHDSVPPRIIAVDKKKQVLAIIENKNPLQMSTTYLCTTGQVPGDKVVEGDLKTPEGIYFVVQHIKSGLNFSKYGNEAYTLNYPNPVDKLRKKTGFGIWVHGRGTDIAPLQTEGCISLNNNDLRYLGRHLSPGSPLILSSTFQLEDPLKKTKESIALEQRVKDWAKAWEKKSEKLFGFYDKDAYSLSTESFKAFADNKKRLFKVIPWIKIEVSDIQCLQGPGYWVSWFYQDYQASNLKSKGIRRLYWAEKENGKFEIIGMEWVPGLESSPILLAEKETIPPTESTADAIPDLNDDSSPKGAIERPETKIIIAEEKTKIPLSIATPLSSKEASSDEEILMAELSTSGGVFGAVHPAKATELAQSIAVPLLKEEPKITPQQKLLTAIPESPSKKTSKKITEEESPLPEEKYDENEGSSKDEEAPREYASASVEESNIDSKKGSNKDSKKDKQKPEFLAIQSLIEDWTSAWKNANLDSYMSFYAKKTMQGNMKSFQAIKEQKKRIWKNNKPSRLLISDIKIIEKNGLIEAKMLQDYADSQGYSDKGLKTLRFKKINKKWLITEEVWIAR